MAHYHVLILKNRNKNVKRKHVLWAVGLGIHSAARGHFGTLLQGLLYNIAVFLVGGSPLMLLISFKAHLIKSGLFRIISLLISSKSTD